MTAQDRAKTTRQPQGTDAAHKKQTAGQQTQESRQSEKQSDSGGEQGASTPSKSEAGIGSSQRHDKPARREGAITGAGTADIERSSVAPANGDNASSEDSMVNDPTGAFKERP